MNKYSAQEQAYKNGYELGKKVKQEEFAEQFIKGFNEGVKDVGLIKRRARIEAWFWKLKTKIIEKFKRMSKRKRWGEVKGKKNKDGYLKKSEVQLLIQNYIRNIQMNDYGNDDGIPQLYAVMKQIDNLPTIDMKGGEG